MGYRREELRFNGWGLRASFDLRGRDAEVWAFVRRPSTCRAARDPGVPPWTHQLPEPSSTAPRSPPSAPHRADRVHTDAFERAFHAVGKSYYDLLRIRAGALPARPTRSSTRTATTRCRAVLACCAERGIAVVPYGGGSSVVGGVEAQPRGRGGARHPRHHAHADRAARARRGQPHRDLRGRDLRPGARGRARGAAASPSATSRSRSSSPPSAAGSRRAARASSPTATAAPRSGWWPRAWRPRAGSGAPSPSRRSAAGPDLNQLDRGLRGHPRRDHRGDGEGAPGRRGARLRLLPLPGLGGGGGGGARDRPGRAPGLDAAARATWTRPASTARSERAAARRGCRSRRRGRSASAGYDAPCVLMVGFEGRSAGPARVAAGLRDRDQERRPLRRARAGQELVREPLRDALPARPADGPRGRRSTPSRRRRGGPTSRASTAR